MGCYYGFVPPMKEGDQIVPKHRSTFTHEETEKMARNYRTLNMLFCGLDSNGFSCMSGCDTTKEVWDPVETAYERTSQVREYKISLYIHQYEIFKMQPRESIKDMYMCFIKKFNNFKSLEKTYINEEMVEKVL